jgi:RimJ/RimL family protein N-acetyltransferase
MKKPSESGGEIRTLTKADIPQLRDHLFRLDPKSRSNRFLGNVSDSTLSTYPERCCEHGAEAIGYFQDGVMRGVAEMHPDGVEDSTAEIAFSVEPEFRRTGIGSELFRRVIGHARERRIDHLRMNCHPQNREMQALARKFQADIAIDRTGNIGRIKTRTPALNLASPSSNG